MSICSQEEFESRREIQEIKKAGGICPKCNHNDNCPNPNRSEMILLIACVWYEPKPE